MLYFITIFVLSCLCENAHGVTSCLQCRTPTCVLLPTQPGIPCYQGNNSDVQECYLKDPVVQSSTVDCGVCSDFQFPYFFQNDPLFPEVELWLPNSLSPTTTPYVPTAVDELDINAYLGLWYQTYANIFSILTFEKDGFCCTATYGTLTATSISVHNYQTLYAPNGTEDIVDGFAVIRDPTEPGQLTVEFYNISGPPAPYWIYQLGPINDDGLYDYAIVSDSGAQFLFVLARNVEYFYTHYNEEVQQSLLAYGFTGLKAPVQTYHGADCVYEQTEANDDTEVENNSSSDEEGFSDAYIPAIAIGAVLVVTVIVGIIYFKRKSLGKYSSHRESELVQSPLVI